MAALPANAGPADVAAAAAAMEVLHGLAENAAASSADMEDQIRTMKQQEKTMKKQLKLKKARDDRLKQKAFKNLTSDEMAELTGLKRREEAARAKAKALAVAKGKAKAKGKSKGGGKGAAGGGEAGADVAPAADAAPAGVGGPA